MLLIVLGLLPGPNEREKNKHVLCARDMLINPLLQKGKKQQQQKQK